MKKIIQFFVLSLFAIATGCQANISERVSTAEWNAVAQEIRQIYGLKESVRLSTATSSAGHVYWYNVDGNMAVSQVFLHVELNKDHTLKSVGLYTQTGPNGSYHGRAFTLLGSISGYQFFDSVADAATWINSKSK